MKEKRRETEQKLIIKYSDLLNIEYFSKKLYLKKYVSNFQSILSKELEMLKKKEIDKIIITDDKAELLITFDTDFRTTLQINNFKNEIQNISFYKYKNEIVLFYQTKNCNRNLAYYIWENSSKITCEISNVDLWGANISKFDETKQLSNCTMVRKQNSFYFFRNGELLKKVDFNGKIVNNVFLDGYLLNDKKQLFYCYYNNEEFNIVFWKAAEDIEQVVDSCLVEFRMGSKHSGHYCEYGGLKKVCPIYRKNGRLYVAYSIDVEILNFYNKYLFMETDKKEYCLDDAAMTYYNFFCKYDFNYIHVNKCLIFKDKVKIELISSYKLKQNFDKKILKLENKIVFEDEMKEILEKNVIQ